MRDLGDQTCMGFKKLNFQPKTPNKHQKTFINPLPIPKQP